MANVVRKAFGKYAHEFVIVKDVAAFQRTSNQLVNVLSDAEPMLS